MDENGEFKDIKNRKKENKEHQIQRAVDRKLKSLQKTKEDVDYEIDLYMSNDPNWQPRSFETRQTGQVVNGYIYFFSDEIPPQNLTVSQKYKPGPREQETEEKQLSKKERIKLRIREIEQKERENINVESDEEVQGPPRKSVPRKSVPRKSMPRPQPEVQPAAAPAAIPVVIPQPQPAAALGPPNLESDLYDDQGLPRQPLPVPPPIGFMPLGVPVSGPQPVAAPGTEVESTDIDFLAADLIAQQQEIEESEATGSLEPSALFGQTDEEPLGPLLGPPEGVIPGSFGGGMDVYGSSVRRYPIFRKH